MEDQGSSGTCWSYSAGSFLESEMIKQGGPSIPLSKIYTARCSYEEKAVNYLRMHGSLNYGDGGLAHDVVNMYAKYGAIPEEAYTGLNFGNERERVRRDASRDQRHAGCADRGTEQGEVDTRLARRP